MKPTIKTTFLLVLLGGAVLLAFTGGVQAWDRDGRQGGYVAGPPPDYYWPPAYYGPMPYGPPAYGYYYVAPVPPYYPHYFQQYRYNYPDGYHYFYRHRHYED